MLMDRNKLMSVIVRAVEKAGGRVYLCHPVVVTDDFIGAEEPRTVRFLQREPGTVAGCGAVVAGGGRYRPFSLDGSDDAELNDIVTALPAVH